MCAGAENKEEHGERKGVRDADHGEEYGGGKVREDHCLDVAESFGDTGGEQHGTCCYDGGGEEEGSEAAVFEVELPFEEPCYPGSVNHVSCCLVMLEEEALQRSKTRCECIQRK